jgi:hypothetical protein
VSLFSSLALHGWRQIGRIEVAFHPRLTILTGANGAGKTTLLSLLARHFGWNAAFISTPRYQEAGILEYWTDLWEAYFTNPAPEHTIGEIAYAGGRSARLAIPTASAPTYNISIHGQANVRGVHIPSHRPLYAYQQLESIPTSALGKDQLYQRYSQAYQQRFQNQWAQRSPSYLLKESLVSLGIFGFGSEVVQPNPEARRLFLRFQDILRTVLPPKLRFQAITIRAPEVVLVTHSGEFVLDAVSGGIASIIDIAWQIFMYAPAEEPFVVTIDEPENHLHPELQRTLLAALLTAFPNGQFVVASHNPFIVSSVPESHVYVLDFSPDDNKVYSTLLDLVEKSGSANEILRDVLGLPVTMPLWVQGRLEAIVQKYSASDLTPETFNELRNELSAIGLGKYVPDTIADVLDRRSSQ